ncbi:MAG: TIGR02281 family clan AA aspartic protease [Sphingomonas bacterium]|nr:TIGR02281 family clan AA aspartic protease [Sphingomonas bacterium]
MSQDQGMNTFYLVLCLILVASSLIAMRLPIGKALRMVLAWVAIFGVVFTLFAFRGEFSALGTKLRAEATGAPIESGEELRIAIRDDGHFWVNASVNGEDGSFLVDSGASITTISPDLAAAAKVETGMRVAQVETANGEVRMPVAKVARFDVGSIARTDFTIHVNSADDTNVLGMNFLSSLRSWRVEGNTLVLKP